MTVSDGPPAAWISAENRRPSSFIPAPPRAEGPSLVAAPPASSDRLVHPDDLEEKIVVRTFPIRVDIEQGGGRFDLLLNPAEIHLRPGEAVEWDFRYVGGSDAIVEDVVVEFQKASPFSKNSFRSQKPGSARPHRQLSGPVQKAAAGKHFEYVIRCMNIIRREVGSGRGDIRVSVD